MQKAATVKLRIEQVEAKILLIREQKVMLDADLAELYAVDTKVLLQAVKRNVERFPADFMFQLTAREFSDLRSQTVTSNGGRGGRRYAPYSFTEQGVAMLSSVLRSPRAIAANVEIMRAFVRLRKILVTNAELARRFGELEVLIEKRLANQDQAIAGMLVATAELMRSGTPPKTRPIGFITPRE